MGGLKAAQDNNFKTLLSWRRTFAARGHSGTRFRFQHLLYASIIPFRRGDDFGQLFAVDQDFDLVGVENFTLEQSHRNPDQRRLIVGQDAYGCVVALANHTADFVVDLDGGGFAVIAMLSDFTAQENLLFFLAEGQGS